MMRRALLFALLLAGASARAQLTIEDWEEPARPEAESEADAEDTAGDVDAWAAPASGSTSTFTVTARPYGFVRTRGGVDTRFDSARGEPLAENVVDLRARLRLGLDVKLSETVRVLVEGRGHHRTVGQRRFDRTKSLFEPELGEAYVDLYGPSFDLRVGHQIVAFGANPAFAPSDALNPRDLRDGFLLALPDELKLPNTGVRARGRVGKVDVTAVYFPFFRPNKYAVVGQDDALVQPSLGVALPVEVHHSIEDGLQPHLLETERPRAFPWQGELGLRGTTKVGAITAGASWVWMYEKTPRVELDPELSALVRAQARGRDPDPALVVSLQDRVFAGEEVLHGRYTRQHLLSLEAQALWGTSQVDVDLAFSPGQTLYDANLNPIRKRTLTWVVGVSQAQDSPLFYSVNYVGLAVPDLPSEGYLFLLEPATAAGAPRTVWFHALVAEVGYSLFDRRLSLNLRAGAEPIQRSFALAPSVTWREGRHTVGLAVELFEGRAYSPFGYWNRNDQVVGSWSMDVF